VRHHLYGLRVDSEIPLGFADDDALPPDVRIRWAEAHTVGTDAPDGEVIARRMDAGTALYTVASTPRATTIRFHGSCDVAISPDLDLVEVAPDPGFPLAMVPVLLVGTVGAVLLSLRGFPVLHGAAVERAGAAVGLVGPSGIGKSTLAALCCAAGARLVSDDVVPVELGDPPRLAGGWPELRLRPAAASIAGLFPTPPPSRVTPDGRVGLACPASAAARPPLSALVLPRPSRDRGELAVMRLAPVQATFSLISADRIDGWSTVAAQRAQFDASTRLAAAIPTFAAHVPWGPPFRSDHGRELLDRVLVLLA
jgi:hypothetical protein